MKNNKNTFSQLLYLLWGDEENPSAILPMDPFKRGISLFCAPYRRERIIAMKFINPLSDHYKGKLNILYQVFKIFLKLCNNKNKISAGYTFPPHTQLGIRGTN
jgi:hypothetical protein